MNETTNFTRDRIRDFVFRNAPRLASRARKWRSEKEAWLLHRRLEAARSLDEKVDLAISSNYFPANQKRTEILDLLNLLQGMQPDRLCEIGTAQGGTLALFCQIAAPDARIVSVDINYRSEQMAANPHLARRGQELLCLAADSHADQTIEEVRMWLAGAKLDFLFIDGDHSFEGVSADYRLFAPLVDPRQGVVALHDIVPDFKTRHGTPTAADVGQVPEFWAQLKLSADVVEFLEDREQDGMGIGVVQLSSEEAKR